MTNLRTSIVTMIVLAAPAIASADCPSTHLQAVVGCDAVCSYISTDTWACTADDYSSITMVSDFDTAVDDYEAWGHVADDKFCCTWEPSSNDPVSHLVINGSDQVDFLSFNYATGSNNLHSADGELVDATIYGNASNDTIRGSNDDDLTTYSETLRGGPNDDTIIALAGDDTCYGDSDNDTITGGAGDDYIEGNGGNDTLLGGVGDDTILGQEGDDSIGGMIMMTWMEDLTQTIFAEIADIGIF